MTDGRLQIGRAADRIRDELASTLSELDRRRHVAMDFRYQVKEHLPWLAAAVGGLALLAGGGFAWWRAQRRRDRGHLFQDRLRGFVRAWEHPKRIAARDVSRSLPVELARKAAIGFVVAAVSQVARRSAQRLLPDNGS
jgi:hypothetical protein